MLLLSAAHLAVSAAHAQPYDRAPVDRPLINRPAVEELRGQLPTEPLANRVSRPWVQSAWVPAHSARARLVAGKHAAGGRERLVAGIEIRLAPDWKTYWRHPGDDGGIPPRFDFSASRNLARANVMFPAPHRIKGLNGYSIGYKNAVVFPVEIEAADPSRPVVLDLALEYGICREICVPAEARIRLEIPPGLSGSPPGLGAALAAVPHSSSEQQAGDPALKSARAALGGSEPALDFEIASNASTDIDLLVEAPDGRYLPLPRKVGSMSGGRQRFRVPLTGIDNIASLTGTSLRLTILAGSSGVETHWTVR
jgi:DsbC/DsbD-like thiol-disulfide interchange protein